MFGPLLPGQTAIDDLSGLRLRKIRTVAELNAAESEISGERWCGI